MYLDTTSKTLEIILGSAKTTNDCEWTADIIDTQSGTTFGPANFIGLSNGTTAVTAVAAPAASTVRKISAFTFFNADTVTTTVTVRIFDGTNRRRVIVVTLTPGQSLIYTPEGGWSIMQSTVGQIPGTKTNDNAAPGNVGEFLNSVILSGSPVLVNSLTPTDITNITLTPGDWDVWGSTYFNGNGTGPFVIFVGWTSTTSASLPTPPNNGGYGLLRTSSDLVSGGMAISAVRMSVNTNTTVYLSGEVQFSAGQTGLYGALNARRRR